MTPLSEPVPVPGDPVGRPTQTLTRLFQNQAQALLRGDQSGWLAAIDPSNKALTSTFTQMFANLRAMGVTSWQPTVGSVKRHSGFQTGTANVAFEYCLGPSTCPTSMSGQSGWQSSIRADLLWGVHDGAVVVMSFTGTGTGTGSTSHGNTTTYPWQTDALTVSLGSRVTVAAAPSVADQVQATLAAATSAAGRADAFSLRTQPLARYTIYLAGPSEWSTWFGVRGSADRLAYMMPTSPMTYDIVLQSKEIHGSGLEAALRFEMGTIVTVGDQTTSDASMWLRVGLSEYVAYGDLPARMHWGNPMAWQYVSNGSWDGHLAIAWVAGSSAATEDAWYAMSYLSVRSLIDRYGKDRFLEFFKLVVLRTTSLDAASSQAFGAPWAQVDAACAADVRRMAR